MHYDFSSKFKKDQNSSQFQKTNCNTDAGKDSSKFERLEGDIFGECQGIEYAADQTFGVEIEITCKTGTVCFGSRKWRRFANFIISALQQELGTGRVYDFGLEYHEGQKLVGIDAAKWRVESDESAGWEVISPILIGFDGFVEIVKVSTALDKFLSKYSELCIDHYCGFHLTLATRLSESWQRINLLKLVQWLEPGLFTLVDPSRCFRFNGASYSLDSNNIYCKPMRNIPHECLSAYLELLEFRWFDDQEEIFDEDDCRNRTVNMLRINVDDNNLIEIRMCHGTCDYEIMIPWISLWMNITCYCAGDIDIPLVDQPKVFSKRPTLASPESEDIFRLLEKFHVPISSELEQRLFEMRETLWPQWSKALPRYAVLWESHGFYDASRYKSAQFSIKIKYPDDCSDYVIRYFIQLVHSNCPKSVKYIKHYAYKSQKLGFVYHDKVIVGVGSLNRNQKHKSILFNAAGIPEKANRYDLELGRIYLKRGYNKTNVRQMLLRDLIASAEPRNGLFIAVKLTSHSVIKILESSGLVPIGKPFSLKNVNGKIGLFGKLA
jgi:hypothetical protein